MIRLGSPAGVDVTLGQSQLVRRAIVGALRRGQAIPVTPALGCRERGLGHGERVPALPGIRHCAAQRLGQSSSLGWSRGEETATLSPARR